MLPSHGGKGTVDVVRGFIGKARMHANRRVESGICRSQHGCHRSTRREARNEYVLTREPEFVEQGLGEARDDLRFTTYT